MYRRGYKIRGDISSLAVHRPVLHLVVLLALCSIINVLHVLLIHIDPVPAAIVTDITVRLDIRRRHEVHRVIPVPSPGAPVNQIGLLLPTP